MSHDPESQSHDYTFEESELFPVSRASSCTVVSEQEKRVLSPSASLDRETPVVKPHPFSFRTTPLSTMGSSTDSYHRQHTNSESDCFDRNSDTTSYRAVRSKSNSLNYSGEFSCSASGSLKNSPLVAGTVAKQQQYSHMRNPSTTDATVSSTTSNSLCTCNSRDHPVASKDGESFGYRQFQCKCHFGDPRSCAFDPKIESMGLCPINNGFVTFDPNRRYSDDKGENPGVIIINTPPRDSCDSVSLSSNFSQSPRSMQVCSPPYLTSKTSPSLSGGPYNNSTKNCYSSGSVIRTSCTSIDSGYEKSMSMSSFTSSAKDPISLTDTVTATPQYGSTGDVSGPTKATVTASMDTKPRARSLCEMEPKSDKNNSNSSKDLFSATTGLYPKLPSLTPQLVIEDFSINSHLSFDPKHLSSLTSTCSSDASTPIGPLSKSTTPSPTSSIGNTAETKAELKRAFFANKGKKVKGIRTIEDSKMKEQSSLNSRPRSDAVSFSQDSHWKTKSCEVHVTKSVTPLVVTHPDASDNHVTSTPTFFGTRTLADNTATNNTTHTHQQYLSNQFNPSYSSNRFNMCGPYGCPPDLPPATCNTFPVNPFATKFEPHPSNLDPPRFGSPGNSKSISSAVAMPPTLILPSDAQSVSSEADSGHCTKSIDDRSQLDGDICSQASELSHLSNLDNTSEYSEAENDVFTAKQRVGIYGNQPNQLCQLNQCAHADGIATPLNPEGSLSASCLRLHRDNPSLLQERLMEHESTLFHRGRPRMLEQFEDFTDVELPTFDEFCLDEGSADFDAESSGTSLHRHRMGDFGHSLFAG